MEVLPDCNQNPTLKPQKGFFVLYFLIITYSYTSQDFLVQIFLLIQQTINRGRDDPSNGLDVLVLGHAGYSRLGA
jgi:hypothetical protein